MVFHVMSVMVLDTYKHVITVVVVVVWLASFLVDGCRHMDNDDTIWANSRHVTGPLTVSCDDWVLVLVISFSNSFVSLWFVL